MSSPFNLSNYEKFNFQLLWWAGKVSKNKSIIQLRKKIAFLSFLRKPLRAEETFASLLVLWKNEMMKCSAASCSLRDREEEHGGSGSGWKVVGEKVKEGESLTERSHVALPATGWDDSSQLVVWINANEADYFMQIES